MPKSCSDSADLKDMFSRTRIFLGRQGFDALRNAFVVVVGLGGVGSHAALALTRAGIGRLRLVDFDKVDPSNLNRHAVATLEDVGQSKAAVVKRRLLDILPQAEIEAKEAFFHRDTADSLLGDSPDYVIDAIDGLNTKVALLAYAVQHDLKIVSAMGASMRSDPSLIRIGGIETTEVCPLARVVRKRLRRQGVYGGITAIYSTEPPLDTLPPDETQETFRGGRKRRILPSLSTLPGIFGYTAANLVMTDIAGYSAPKKRARDD